MIVMGMDPSLTGFGVAYRFVSGSGQVLWASRISPPNKMRGVARLVYIENAVTGFIERYSPTLVAYEDYAFAGGRKRGSNTIFGIGELGGVIKKLLYSRGIAILAVPPTSLKLFATGSGRAEKEEVAEYVYRTEGVRFKTSDQSDAAALLKMGEAYANSRLLPRTRGHYQRKALAGCSIVV
jgi:crossover junction endodeoxyribonuclease RuvC